MSAPATPHAAAPTRPAPKQADGGGDFLDTVKFVAGLALAVLILRSFFLSPFNIPSESMLPRLVIGDYLVVNKMAYGYSRHSLPLSPPLFSGRLFAKLPARGDVAVFKAPPEADIDYIKRVVGLPGDLIEVRRGQLIVNGAPVQRQRVADFILPVTDNMLAAAGPGGPEAACSSSRFLERAPQGGFRCRYPQYRETLPGGRTYLTLDLLDGQADDYPAIRVPEGHLFLMGDNRDRSLDSRFPATPGGGIGLVPVDNLVGRALVGLFATTGAARWYNPFSWITSLDWNRAGDGF